MIYVNLEAAAIFQVAILTLQIISITLYREKLNRQCIYLEVLLVRHLQGDDVGTSGTAPGSSARASDGTDDTVFDATEEIANTLFDPPFEATYPVEGDGHLVRFIVALLSSALKNKVSQIV